ncbi:MAG: GNAT family N-acetyltransferase [Ktedonobacteraceae bacterium]
MTCPEFIGDLFMLIRRATPEAAAGIARVRVDTWRAAYRGIVPDEFLDNMSYAGNESRWAERLSDVDNQVYTFVAIDESGQIFGFVSGGPNRDNDPVYKSELYAIYILPSHHGLGIGRRLTVALVEKLLETGFDSMLLWVFTDNLARRFYEALGGQLIKSSQFELNGTNIDEVAYGWLDIRTLLKEQKR